VYVCTEYYSLGGFIFKCVLFGPRCHSMKGRMTGGGGALLTLIDGEGKGKIAYADSRVLVSELFNRVIAHDWLVCYPELSFFLSLATSHHLSMVGHTLPHTSHGTRHKH